MTKLYIPSRSSFLQLRTEVCISGICHHCLVYSYKTGWVEARVPEFVEKLLSRVLSRLFVGLPLCRSPGHRLKSRLTSIFLQGRDPGYVTHVRNHETVSCGILHKSLSAFISPRISARLLTQVPAHIEHGTKYLAPIIQERLEEENQYGPDRHKKPV
jgi:hypothetical protein